MLEYLALIYKNPNQKRNYRREFKALKQAPNQRFIDFYFEFIRLISHLKRDKEENLEDLRKKVLLRLSAMWDG